MSTQVLTELPNIQIAGMDYRTVLAEMQGIIEDNPNWKDNWPEFYNSEAGQVFLQLMSWITDNMSTRQDVLFNEMFLTTAQKDVNKIRHLKQIAYIPMLAHSSKVALNITLNKTLSSRMYLTPPVSSDLSFRPTEIMKITGKDINGSQITWEILKIVDGKPNYLDSVALSAGNVEYTNDSSGNIIYALQGETKYEELTTDTNDGPYIDLSDTNIAADSIKVYNKQTGEELLYVSSFVSKDALDTSLAYPYVMEMNEDQTFRIRFGNADILNSKRLLPAGTTVSIFYRVTDGAIGNIPNGFINYTTNITDESNVSYQMDINNSQLGAGGTNKESLSSAVLNGPLSLRTMDRAVTPEDYNIILDRNTSIFKSKTYTATNMPVNFKSYYGRYINPQESFSFVILNKNYENVPTSKYNYYPWFTSSLEPRLNERYVFDSADYDTKVNIGGTYYNYTINNADTSTVSFKNATILKPSDDFKNSLYSESGEPNELLKLKISTDKTDARYFNDIVFSLLSENTYSYISMDNSILSYDDHARFVSNGSYDLSEPVDLKDYRYITLIIDGKPKVDIDLYADRSYDFNEDDSYYLLWDNEGVPNAEELYGYSSSKKDAAYRDGIVQVINKSLALIVNSAEEHAEEAYALFEKDTSYQYFGFNFQNSSSIVDTLSVTGDTCLNIMINPGNSTDEVAYLLKINGNDWQEVWANLYQSPRSYAWNSLLGLADYLQYAFKFNGCHLKKYIKSGSTVTITDAELGELEGLSASVIQVIDPDIDTTGTVSGAFDLVIKSTDLQDHYSYTDSSGFIHNLYNVLNLDDHSPIMDSSNVTYNGLIHVIKGSASYSTNAKTLIPEPLQAADYENLASMIVGENNTGFFKIQSPITGESSSICFKINNSKDFMYKFLNLHFRNNGYSYKAYGVKRAYLVTKEVIRGFINIEGFDSTVEESVEIGDVLFQNSSIYNSSDFTELYANFKTDVNDRIIIGSVYNNFYYSGDNVTDSELKEDIAGLTGQYMEYDTLGSGVKSYYINEDKSNFEIKLTTSKQDTNSLYAIEDDLGVVCCDRVTINSADINGCPSTECPLIFSIDEHEEISVYLSTCSNGKQVATAIANELKKSEEESINKNFNTIARGSYTVLNQVVISNLSKSNGNITFKHPPLDLAILESDVKELYKNFFGTNLTNSDFYDLYPKNTINEANVVYVNDDQTEYYYYPSEDHNLVFRYRKMTEVADEYGETTMVSKPADYYIDVEESPYGDQYKYRFSIVKSDNSSFPDTYFYVHVINNKKYNFDINNNIKETDESVLQSYMKQYKISGTDIIFLQPYFKTYDIAATIKYNRNYTETEIVQNVRAAVDKVCDLKYSEIAGSMSRAKILKAIMNVNGVEDCKITYFGYDYSSGTGSTDTLDADFFEILCLHEDEDMLHGKVFTYETID